jgi:hypothetical protein
MLCLLLGGCQTALRQPLCREGEVDLPPGVEGRYRYTQPTQSTIYSGSSALLQTFEFEIQATDDGYVLYAQKVPMRDMTACRIGGAYYAQTRNNDGTFGLARIDLAPSGVTATGLVFDPGTLERNGFGYVFMPAFHDYDPRFSIGWQSDSGDKTRLIVDNRDLSDARREELVTLAEPSAISLMFSRLPPEASGRHKVKLRRVSSWRRGTR